MAPEFWCQTTPTEFWCHGISGAKLHFADVAPLLEFGTTTPCALNQLRFETTLKLDILVGDIEDAVSCSVNRNLRKQTSSQKAEEVRFPAINALKLAEDVLTNVSRTRPQWSRLVSAVDDRVGQQFGKLRSQTIADYRSLLNSLKWPPPLSTLNPSNTQENRSPESTNPLFTMRELVNPISVASERHFAKWADKPELIFALVYKITRDYVDIMDELLQPLVDEAMLSGYSCREEWISAMVKSLSDYMAKEIIPVYISQLDEDIITENRSQAKISWLHFIDLMISFDKKIKTLLELWAEIELSDAIEKLRPEIEDEKKWLVEAQQPGLILGSEDCRSSTISSAFLRRLSSIIERCRSIPGVTLRARFIRLAGAPIIHKFLDSVLLRCLEAEGLTALTDDDALIKVMKSINNSRYIESVLKEWREEVFFLEMGFDQDQQPGGIIDEEVNKLVNFRIEWVEKLSTVILRGFDACSREYLKNRKQWMEKTKEGWAVSRSFIGALDYLQAKMSILELNLNKFDFVGVWRTLATAIDSLFFIGIFMSNAKFYDVGVERLANDLTVLFGVFKAWCLRHVGFFPKSSEGLKILKMEDKQLRGSVEGGDRWLNHNVIRHLTVSEVERIMKSRVYG
ncbi:RINT1-like protein MAG2 [Tanacetum coccineum]